jgi:hypothetical protein
MPRTVPVVELDGRLGSGCIATSKMILDAETQRKTRRRGLRKPKPESEMFAQNEFRHLLIRRSSLCILFRGDLLSRADGFVEEVGGVVDFNLCLAVKLAEHFVGLVFPPEHHVLERIIDMNILAFPKDIK